jgi:hypothetical protein
MTSYFIYSVLISLEFFFQERSSKAKLLQFVSGVNAAVYWTTAMIWDYSTFVVTCVLTVLTLFIFQEDEWSTFDELGKKSDVLFFFLFDPTDIIFIHRTYALDIAGIWRCFFANDISIVTSVLCTCYRFHKDEHLFHLHRYYIRY